MDTGIKDLSSAIGDFRRARSQANLKELLARLKGETTQLLSYDEVRSKLKLHGGVERGLKDIPLDSIVGSVGRYTDFTRDFLPRQEVDQERWARVKVATSGLAGLPPIDVYQIGEVYFVKDGNHRVSVARQLGATHIQAYVTDVRTRVPLTPDVKPDDLIIKAEHANFLQQTRIDVLRPGAELYVSTPGGYQTLLEHIDVHRYFMGIDFQHDISYQEAVIHWYDTVYSPVIEIIHSQGILHHFPKRTETDLYLWIGEHRAHLEEELGWQIKTKYVAGHLVDHFGQDQFGLFSNLGGRFLEIILPDMLEAGPPPGEWRARMLDTLPDDRIFSDILVPINGRDDGWCALEQALVIAKYESGELHGLHVVSSEANMQEESPQAVKTEFEQRCGRANVRGKLTLTPGKVVDQICMRAAVADLVIVNLSYPPATQPLTRMSSGFRDLIQRCPRPILATPQTISPLSRTLLAYDGSLKAKEALYIATYLAGQWRIPLVVVSVIDNRRVTKTTLKEAEDYLKKYHVQATYLAISGPQPEAILEAAETQGCDLLIMGGYGHIPVLDMVLGSAVDQVLRTSSHPTLICR